MLCRIQANKANEYSEAMKLTSTKDQREWWEHVKLKGTCPSYK